MAKVSVIVAVYNAERTLQRCIDSLVHQSLQDIEIILVDDGSSDGSGSICDRYAQADSRIKVFHKRNEGVSKTKQLGLNHSTGEYIIFLDSDDYVDLNIYGKLYQKAIQEQADIVCCDILRINGDKRQIEGHSAIVSFEHVVFLDGIIDILFGSICNRIVKRSLFEEFQVRFNPEISFGEDKLVLVELLSKSLKVNRILKISYIPETLLFYDTSVNPSSLMKLNSEAKLNAQIRRWKEMGRHLDLDIFGKTYYLLLVKHGFKCFWNRNISKESFQSLFSPMIEGLCKYAPLSAQKILVTLAASGKWGIADMLRWIAYPRILSDKIKLYFEHR